MNLNSPLRHLPRVAALLVLAACTPCARADLYGPNQLLNGDAESSAGSYSGSDLVAVPHWTTAGGFTVAQYGNGSGVLANCPGPAARGANFFAGGPNNSQSTAWQEISVSAIGAEIDANCVVCNLSGWFGGWLGDNDNAKLTASFLSATGQTLASLTIGPVTAAERANATALQFRQAAVRPPAATRTIRCTLTMTRAYGSYNDGYADNLSLTLANLPPPAVSLDTNLLANPDAELGSGSVNGTTVVSVPGWTTTGNFTIAQYGQSSDVLPGNPGPPNRGANYFFGGYTTSPTSASQELDVYARATEIDAGSLSCNLSGWLGGWLNQNDNAQFSASFFDASNQALGSMTIGPVSSAERAAATSLLYRNATAKVPSGTRTIHCLLVMTHYVGDYNDGLADNLALTLSPPPQLSIVADGDNATVSWPVSTGDWTLQRTFNLATNPVVWSDMAPPYQTSGNSLACPITGVSSAPAQFFRLRR
ncbi:MAG: hypothetical protein WCJ14_00600 [Verrucomicrobiota bacterium]